MLGRVLSELKQNQYDLKSSTNFCKELVSLKVCGDLTLVHMLHRVYYRLWRLPLQALTALQSVPVFFPSAQVKAEQH